MVEPRDRRIPIMFSEEELAEIDEWRHDNRIATRADAVRRLCKIALLVDREFEQAVDMATDGVDVLSDHSSELSEVFRLVINRETYGMTFDRDQLWDLFTLAREQADVAEEGLRHLQTMLVTIFNAVAAIIDARSIKTGFSKSKEVIEKAVAAMQEAEARKAERDAQSNENRYLMMAVRSEDGTLRADYQALSEDEKDEYLREQIEILRAEEAADPEGFAKRHGIDNRKFWEKPEWQEFLDERWLERQKEDGEL